MKGKITRKMLRPKLIPMDFELESIYSRILLIRYKMISY